MEARIVVQTGVKAVTVYPDRARVVRQGQTEVETGVQRLEIADLPLSMNPDSVRATARGTARVRLLGLQIERQYYSETPAEQVRGLEARVESAQDEMQALEAEALLLRKEGERLEALAGHTQVFATALASGEMSLETQLQMLAGLRQRAAQLNTELQENGLKKRAQERRLEQLKRQLEQVRSARPRERYAAFVEVDVQGAGSLGVELTYVVSGAGWKPLYDLRLLEADQAVLEVGYLAQVSQQTGEDWADVELVLSTARPALAAVLPELQPWYIRERSRPQPPPPAPRQMAMKAAAMPQAAMDTMAVGFEPEAVPEVEAEVAMANVESSGAAVTYRLAGKVGIPSDGAPHKVTVAQFSLPPRLDYACAPKLAEAAYRRAKVTNDSPYTLLPGAANLFAGEEFIGATRLELTAPQGEIELYLGADDRVKVERELVRREVEKALIGGKRRLHFAYEIRLENLLADEVRITVHDQMPVSRHEDIKVRLEGAEPKPSEQTELNLLDWELTLASREKRTLRFEFAVEYPQALEVIGLP
ncbi:MAG: mucoidy inhibitor MuiA family protein [Chloroflexota bacterium]